MRVFLAPPDGAAWWRLLRRTADTFAGPDDLGAVMIADDCIDDVVLDTSVLVNGTAYFYRLYSWDGQVFTESGPATGTPAQTYEGAGPTPQLVVYDRVGQALAAEVATGRLVVSGGKVDMTTAPFVLSDKATFPTVTIHMDSVEPAERFIGENMIGEVQLTDGTVAASEGWLGRWSLTVLSVSVNSDERIALREAVRRAVQANLSVFDDFGMVQCSFAQRDVEDTQSYPKPLYMSYGTFTCLAPTFVTDAVAPIVDVQVQPYLVSPMLALPDGPGLSLIGGQSANPSLLQAGFTDV